MSVANGRISERMGVKISDDGVSGDLQKVFATTQKSHSWFFTTAPINKWARYKPFRNSRIFTDHYNDSNSARLTALLNANCGLSVPSFRSAPATTLSDTWEYLRCRLGTDPMRAEDFEQYYHNAVQPVIPPGDLTVDLSQSTTFDFGAYIRYNISGGDAISWEDLPASLGNCYLCVVFAKNGSLTGTLTFKTSGQTFSGGGIRLELSNSELRSLQSNAYTYYYLCACSAKKETLSTDTPSGAMFQALPVDTTSDMLGKFTIQTATLKNVTITSASISSSPTRASFVDASNYTGVMPITVEDIDDAYLACSPVGGLYYLHLGVTIETGSSAFSIYSPGIGIVGTFAGKGPGNSRPQSAVLRNSSFTTVSSISIPANSSALVYFTLSVPLLSLDASGNQVGSVSTGQYVSSSLALVQSSQVINIGELRVRN